MMFTWPSGFFKRSTSETGVAVPELGGMVAVASPVGNTVGVDATGMKGVGVAVAFGSAVTRGNAWEMAIGEGNPAPTDAGKLQEAIRTARTMNVHTMRKCFIGFSLLF